MRGKEVGPRRAAFGKRDGLLVLLMLSIGAGAVLSGCCSETSEGPACEEDAGSLPRDAGPGLPDAQVAPRDAGDAGVVPGDAGDAGPNPSGRCAGNSDCPQGQVCSFFELRCVDEAQVCGMPGSSVSGNQYVGALCRMEEGAGCRAGLVCVLGATSRHVNQDFTGYEPNDSEGICEIACDPCSPQCPWGMECIALGGGEPGGFCNEGPLRGNSGMRCGVGVLCQGVCHYGLSPVCSGPPCLPDDAQAARSLPPDAALASQDCGLGEVCVRVRTLPDVFFFECRPGRLAGTGESCGGDVYCQVGPCVTEVGICLQACDDQGGCPGGGDCVRFGNRQVCVPDDTLPLGAACDSTSHCQTGLECRAGRCLPPS